MKWKYLLKKHSSKLIALSAIVLIYAFWNKLLGNNEVSLNKELLTPGVNHTFVANTIWDSMKIAGTLEDEIFFQLNGLSKEDLKKVFVEFGDKDYNNMIGGEGWFGMPQNLTFILKQELGGDDLLNMQQIWNGTGLW